MAWIRRFILYQRKRHPSEMCAPEITVFLSNLAVPRHVSSSTQNQALSAILFLYRHVLKREVGAGGARVGQAREAASGGFDVR